MQKLGYFKVSSIYSLDNVSGTVGEKLELTIYLAKITHTVGLIFGKSLNEWNPLGTPLSWVFLY